MITGMYNLVIKEIIKKITVNQLFITDFLG